MTSGFERLASERIGALLNVPVTEIRAAGAQHGCQHLTGRLADGREVFAKATLGAGGRQAAAFAAEANGLRWLAEPGTLPVPAVLGVDEHVLVMELLPSGRPTQPAALAFGAGLALTHAAGALYFPVGTDQPAFPVGTDQPAFPVGTDQPAFPGGTEQPAFGAPWPGFIASLPLDNTPGGDWAQWYAEQRIVPYLRKACDYGALSRADLSLVEAVVARIGDLAGPPEPPSRIHGDLWSGNVLWSGGRGWLIDPAAHGGHRETDLAMLALFGAPHLDAILHGYVETAPLADGWRDRVPLHQLHPLLVHACLFGASYAGQVRAAARAALAG